MKRIWNIVVAAEILLLSSCGAGSSKDNKSELATKKEALEKLKSDQAKIGDQIATLEKEIKRLDTSATNNEKPKLVAIATVVPTSFDHYIDLQGKVDAVNISFITPRGNPGQVKALFVKTGDRVRKGQLLLKMDDVIAKQSLSAAQQSLVAIKSQMDLAKDLFKRRQNLWAQGIGTEVDVLAAKTSAENLEAQYKAQNDNLKNAQEQVNFTSVYSDVDGVADDVNIRVGEIFSGVNQIKIVNKQNLKVTTQVPENYLGKVKVGSHLIINLPDINKTIDAVVNVTSPLIDNNSRSFYIEAKIPSGKEFYPNQVAMVKILDYAVKNTLTVPVNTLQTDDKGKFVMVAATQENGKMVARKRPVQVGEFYGDKMEVKSGLKEGDRIIVEGFQGLYEGQSITTGQ
ncbi:MAG: efflux RND transporter periplasmic adaptor subunit [Bacteroidetes bacterium]|nr:efflux RND transporter periplasmic adaptor subunit [Bacteroidota bacterium]